MQRAAFASARRSWSIDDVAAILLMCLSFASAWIVANALVDSRGIVQLDVWFHLDTDDLMLMGEFSELLRHPNLGLFVRRPVALLTHLLGWLGVGDDAPIQLLYYWLMLLVAPAAGALRTLASYRSLRSLTGSSWLSCLFCLLDIGAFATVAVGGVPESYPLTAACLAGLYWLFVTDAGRGRLRWGRWIGLGALAVGITSTNVMPFAILVASALLASGFPLGGVLARGAACVLAVLGLTVASLLASAVLIGEPLSARIDPSTERYTRESITASAAKEVAWAMANTFMAPYPVHGPTHHTAVDNPDHDFIVLMPTVPVGDLSRWWRGLLPLMALVLGAAGFIRGSRVPWLLPAAAIVFGNAILHVFFGHQYFMYAMHWTFSMVWIMAGAAFLPRRMRTVALSVVLTLTLATAVSSIVLMKLLLAELRAA
jgi:hypothetical protein